MKFNAKELSIYEDNLNAYRDIMNAIKTAEKEKFEEGKAEGLEEGLAQGKAEGLEEGLAQGKAEGLAQGIDYQKTTTAKAMLAFNEPIDKIMMYTGLTKEEIEGL